MRVAHFFALQSAHQLHVMVSRNAKRTSLPDHLYDGSKHCGSIGATVTKIAQEYGATPFWVL